MRRVESAPKMKLLLFDLVIFQEWNEFHHEIVRDLFQSSGRNHDDDNCYLLKYQKGDGIWIDVKDEWISYRDFENIANNGYSNHHGDGKNEKRP